MAVGLFHAPADQIHDGFTLAAYLNSLGLGCALRRFWQGTPRGLALEELTGAASRLIFLSVGEENLEQILRLVPPLSRRREVVLFGRQLHDKWLRKKTLVEGVTALLVGDPRPVCRDLARRLVRGEEDMADLTLAGLFQGVEGTPREPPRHLDSFPPGDYSHEGTQVLMAVPLRSSTGFPFPATVMAERVWEAPLRGVSPERTAELVAHHVQEHGARRFLFTDLAANAAGDDLLRMAGHLVERGLGERLRWYATVWADPALDASALSLLRRSGCRGLRLHIWSGSPDLCQALGLGVDHAVALRICRDAAREGIDLRPLLQVGFPGEAEADRVATYAWLARASEYVRAVDQLSPCALRDGAPLARTGGLYFPLECGALGWHDGGENNDSQRKMWVREARTVCSAQELDHPGRASRQFSARVEPAVRQRLAQQVSAALALAPSWRRRWLHLAGVLHGREAFSGPLELQLDLDGGMPLADAVDVAEQAATMGTRTLALGQHDAPVDQDATLWPGLATLLGRARDLGLEVKLRTRLPELGTELAAVISDGVQKVELTCASQEELEGLSEPVSALAARRLAQELVLPRLELSAWISPALPSPAALVQAALEMGVDRLVLRVQRGQGAGPEPSMVSAALEELEAIKASASTADEASDTLFLFHQGPGWPAGFELSARTRDPERPPECRCPAGKAAREVRTVGALPGALLARYSEQDCQLCEHLDTCPVSRLDFSVTLTPPRVSGLAHAAQDLKDEDLGLGRAARAAERRPCLAGWESARITAQGELFLCPVCGVEPVGNVHKETLAGVWYSRGLNEFRRMSVGASLALPYIDRNRCAMGCGRRGQDQHIVDQIRSLSREQLASLESAGSGDRR